MLPTCLDILQRTRATMQLRRVLCTRMSWCLRFMFSFFLFFKQTLWRVGEVEIRQETFQRCSLISLFCCQRTIPPASFEKEKEKKSYHIKCNWITIKQQRTNSFHFSRQRSEKRVDLWVTSRRGGIFFFFPLSFYCWRAPSLFPVQIKKREWAVKRPRPPARLGTE